MFYGGDKEAEKVYTFKKPFKPREICHENTRFKKDPFLKPIGNLTVNFFGFDVDFSTRQDAVYGERSSKKFDPGTGTSGC